MFGAIQLVSQDMVRFCRHEPSFCGWIARHSTKVIPTGFIHHILRSACPCCQLLWYFSSRLIQEYSRALSEAPPRHETTVSHYNIRSFQQHRLCPLKLQPILRFKPSNLGQINGFFVDEGTEVLYQ